MSRIVSLGVFRLFSNNVKISNKILKKYSFNKTCPLLSSVDFNKKWYQTKIENEKHLNNLKNDGISSDFILKDKDYKPSDDPNVFGGEYCLSDELNDEEDVKEEEFIQEMPSGNKVIYYARRIKKCLDKRQIKEALDILEVEMKKDRVHADRYIFNLLISGCAKAGYTRKTFKLFFKMKQCGLEPNGGTYTSLFNSCANAPTITDGLNKANRVREIMMESEYEPNEKNYNAMIKAYGRCKDLPTAFQLVDEMTEKSLTVQTETFNFLFQACVSDKDYGFRHALVTWHKMKEKSVIPDIYSFNTILQCVKECSLGDIESMNDVINDILHGSTNNNTIIKKENILQIEGENLKENSTENFHIGHTINSSLENQRSTETRLSVSSNISKINDIPNLFCSTPHLGNLIELNEIRKPEERLLLIGGFSGFLEEMQIHKITPSIETFTILLEVIPSTNSAEKKLISIIRKIGLKCDIDFFNTLIKKRCLRTDYNGAKEVLNMIKNVKLHPDVFTYGILSLTCRTKDEARELLHIMKERDLRINIQILGAMLSQGCCNKDFEYISEIMQIALDEKVRPNEAFLRHLSRFSQQCARMMDIRHRAAKSPHFQSSYKKFRENLHVWYQEHGISGLTLDEQIEKMKENPYKKFKEQTKSDANELNKKKIRKHIRNIKLHDLSVGKKIENSSSS